MFRRVEEMFPQVMRDELLRLYRADPVWVEWVSIPDEPGQPTDRYQCWIKQTTWLTKVHLVGGDGFAMWATSVFLAQGPKVFRPTPEQCAALEQVAVNLELSDYAQPYPAILVDLPPGYEPFLNCICHFSNERVPMLNCLLHTPGNRDDIVTTIARPGQPIEKSLQRYDDETAHLGRQAARALRVAVNGCLALTNFGSHADYLYPKEVANDERLAKEDTPRGERARARLPLAPRLVQFDREVRLHRVEGGGHGHGQGNGGGGEKSWHWRRGHWHTVLCGPGKGQRARRMYPPVLVRADKLLGDRAETTTVYKG